MAITLDGIDTAFNGSYLQLSKKRAQITQVAGDKYKAKHLTHSVEFEVPPTTTNMQLLGFLQPIAAQLWAKARR